MHSLNPNSSPIPEKSPHIPIERDTPKFIVKDNKKYIIEEKTILHGRAWKVWQGTQAFFLTLLSLFIGLAFQALRDKWKAAVTGEEKIIIYTKAPPNIPSTLKTSQIAIHPDSKFITPPQLQQPLPRTLSSKNSETDASFLKDNVIISSEGDLEHHELNKPPHGDSVIIFSETDSLLEPQTQIESQEIKVNSYSDGSIAEGEFKNDQLHGQEKRTYPNEKIEIDLFQNEEFIPEKAEPLKAQPLINEKLRNFIDTAKKDIMEISIDDLEKGLNEALQAGSSIQNPEDKTTILSVAERVAQHYIKASQFNKATEVRMNAAQKISLAPPLSDLQVKLQHEHTKLGLKIHPVDTSLFKNHTLALQKRECTDGKTHLHLDAKLSHSARAQLQSTLDAIKFHPDQLLTALPTGFCTTIKVTSESVAYEGRIPANDKNWEGAFSSDIPLNGFNLPDCECQVIHFEGVGKIKIGANSDYQSEYNRITIELDPSVSEAEAADKLNILFATLGLGAVSSSSRTEDIERLKVMQLFRAFYPKEAYAFERDPFSFEQSVESLKVRIGDKIPEMKNKFQHYLIDHPEDMYQQEVYPNQPIWCVKGLVQEVKNAGGIGLFGSITADNFENSVKRLTSMLKIGALSSQDRFKLGIIAAGASSESDLRSGGGESVFVRMLTDQMSKKTTFFPFSGDIIILYDLKLVERIGYAYSHDQYGTKDPAHYEKRPNIVDFTKEINTHETDYLDNEICVHNRISSEFVKGIQVTNLANKNELINSFRQEGFLTKNNVNQECFNGVPIDEFIHIGDFKSEDWD